MNNAVFPHPSNRVFLAMDTFKMIWQKFRRFFREALDSFDTVDLARKEGTVFNRIDGMLTARHRDAEIRLEHSPRLPYDRNLEVRMSIITAELLSPDVRFRINRMFSAEFPRLSIHFRAELQKSKEQASIHLPRCAK